MLSRIIGGCFYLVGALPIAFVLIGQNLFEPESLFGCNRVISDSWVVTYQELSTAPYNGAYRSPGNRMFGQGFGLS